MADPDTLATASAPLKTEPTPVAIVIPCRDDGLYLEEAEDSARAQTHPVVDIVVVDDGSTDTATLRAFDRLEASGIKVIHQAPQGLSVARNTGIAATAAPYILPLDSDDLFAPTYAEKAASVLDAHPNVGIVGCTAELFGDATGLTGNPEYSVGALIRHLFLILPASMFRRADWAAVGGYDAAFRRCEDNDFWFGIVGLGRDVHMLDEVLLRYRRRPGQMSGEEHRALFDAARGQLMRKHLDLYLAHAEEFWDSRSFATITSTTSNISSVGSTPPLIRAASASASWCVDDLRCGGHRDRLQLRALATRGVGIA